jgi:hypothetical protein
LYGEEGGGYGYPKLCILLIIWCMFRIVAAGVMTGGATLGGGVSVLHPTVSMVPSGDSQKPSVPLRASGEGCTSTCLGDKYVFGDAISLQRRLGEILEER